MGLTFPFPIDAFAALPTTMPRAPLRVWIGDVREAYWHHGYRTSDLLFNYPIPDHSRRDYHRPKACEDGEYEQLQWSSVRAEHWKLIASLYKYDNYRDLEQLIVDTVDNLPRTVRFIYDSWNLIRVQFTFESSEFYAKGCGYKGCGMTKEAKRRIETIFTEVNDDGDPYVYELNVKQ